MIDTSAKWVSPNGDCEAPIITGTISAPSGRKQAVISICGLGFFECLINGEKISDDLLVPAWSDYEPRPGRRLLYPLNDTFSHRIYYLDYDITRFLHDGENTIEVWLGNGWYNQHERNAEGDLWYGSPKLAYTVAIEGADGSKQFQHSDERLTWRPGPIVFNNVYLGEKWDDRADRPKAAFPVKVVPAPSSPLYRQTCPPDREIRHVFPKFLGQEEDRRIYDAGVNLTGYVRCTGQGKIVIRYGEELTPDGEVDFISAGENQIQQDEYFALKKRTLSPKFSVKGFRYFEITGDAEDIEVVVVHSDIAVTSSFTSSDETLNWLYDAYIRTQLNNMHYGIVSDCPHRERLGYTGDGQLTCNAAMLLLDSKELYRKWILDIFDCQDPVSGHVQHTAPFYGGGGGPGGWGCAVAVVPFTYYQHYGERDMLKKAYPHMLKWFSYMQSRCENGLVMREEPDGWCLGDWCAPGGVKLPEPFVNTYYFIKSMEIMLQTGDILGCQNHREEISRQLALSKQAFCDAYYDKTSNRFSGSIQGADGFAADLGLADDALLRRMREEYDQKGAYDTGIFGTYVLTRTLFAHGFSDTAFRLLTAKADSSFYHMKSSGATTLWENWDGRESHDHPMFGAVADCLFEFLLGIKAAAPGYEKIRIEPKLPASLSYVKWHITTAAGKIQVEIRQDDRLYLAVTVPHAQAVLKAGGREFPLKPGDNSFVIDPDLV